MLGFGQSITDIEYFYNTDPGFGNATSITVNANAGMVTQTVNLPVGTTLTGFNSLYIRAKDNLNVWSLYDKRVFYVTDLSASAGATSITAAEYFFNTDPGFGNGSAITIDSNTGIANQTVALPVGSTLTGFNTLYIRAQDDLGVWSLYDTRVFYITNEEAGAGASNIAAAEYFFNTDPGFGNATAISVNSNTGELNQVLSLPVNNLEGFNTLYIRTQDDLGVWSLYDKRLFYVKDDLVIANITAAEYFYDTDPGFGNGTAATITPTGNPDEYTIELATTDISCDFHDFYIRLQNSDGTWSLYDYGLDVEVYDNEDPTIVVFPNITAELDASGNASITLADVDNGTFDDCELVSVVLNQTQFDYTCANLGTNTVTITATDAEAKVSTQDVTITVEDNINPVAVTKNSTVQLDALGNATILPSEIENGSTDNCNVTGYSLDVSNFTCTDLGTNTVNLTVTDSGGNTNTASATVTVEDTVKPTVITKPFTVQLDASGNATIAVDDVDDASTDNCTISSRSLDIETFTCAELGANTVTLTITDQSGNSETGTAIVTVEDNLNPIVLTRDITVQLDANGNASIAVNDIENGSTDNCTIANSSLDSTSFTCDDLGDNTVALSVTDQSNNTGTATATVTVEDSIDPVAVAKNITVQLDASGSVIVDAEQVNNGSSDNCLLDVALDIFVFDCSNLGDNNVILTASDSSGNTNTATATITVEDNLNPIVLTRDITVQLDANGNASIAVNDIENGSTDNCTIANSSLDSTSFTCDDLGDNTVALSVTDQSNNTGTATATVTVEDSIDPVAVAKNITVQLDASGSVIVDAEQVNNGSSDNCLLDVALDIFVFDCSNLGDNNVILTASDGSGNASTATATITVEDDINPTALGQDITRDMAGNLSVSISASDVDNGSSDNCDFNLSIDIDTFTAPGNYPVVLTATDSTGNTNTVTVTVTILDSTFGIEDVEISENDISLYPVPTEDYLNIISKFSINSLNIYDLNGKLLERIKKPQLKINLNYLSTGVYFLRFNIDNVIVTKRIIKQ